MSRAYFQMIGSGVKGIIQQMSSEIYSDIGHGTDLVATEKKQQRLGNRKVTDSFQYEPLPAISTPQDQRFRLVTILPGTDEDDIECTLQHESLNQSAHQYEALSYVWGIAPLEHPIQLNGATLQVGASLWEGLYHLRLPDSSRTLWIDQICINQLDKNEKTHQLPLMRDIYRNASQVVVWLGPEDPEHTDKAYSRVRELAAAADDPKHSLNCDPSRGYDDPVFRELALDDSIQIVFLQSPWYTRVWCTQEIVLAKQASLVTGHHTIDWSLFCQGVEYGDQLGAWKEIQFGGMAPSSPVDDHLATRALGLPRTFENPADELLFYLHRTRHRIATNPRDKVYGILGLLRGGSAQDIGIQPSYEVSVEAVFTKVTTRLITTSRNLDVLGFCYCPQVPKKKHPALPPTAAEAAAPLPRWVADWRTASHLLKPLIEDALGNRRITNASRGLKANPRWEDDGTTLVLEGHVVDTITSLSVRGYGQAGGAKHMFTDVSDDEEEEEEAGNAESESSFLKAWKWIKHNSGSTWGAVEYIVLRNAVYVDWEAFVANVQPTNPGTAQGDDFMSVFCQTLCTGTLAPGGLQETEKMFRDWLANLAPIRKLKSWRVDRVGGVFALAGLIGYIKSTWNSFGEFSKYIYHAEDRKLGATENGWLCLLPKTTRQGDQLVVLKGGRFPVILRPREDGKVDFIGEAYVQGIMDGEVFDEKSCVEIKIR